MSEGLLRDLNPAKFFDEENRFRAWSFAEAILDPRDEPQGEPRVVVATDERSDTLYWHNGRVWVPEGETVLGREIRKLLGDAASAKRVNEAIENVKAQTARPRSSILDLPPEKLVVRNGLVDLVAGEFTPGRRARQTGTLTWLDVEYDADAYPEQFDAFLYEVLRPEDVPIMWEVIGYCLYRGYPFQKAVMLLGGGANGKSTLLAALRDFLGERNVAAKELQDLAENRFAVADLEGKLANIAPDISDDELERTGTFKALTGGDLISAERKYQDPFEFENAATLLFSANQAPAAEDETHAYERRWLYFDFPHTFDADDPETVPQQVLLDAFRDEHAGMLNRAAAAFSDLWERGGFEATTYMEERGDRAHERATRPLIAFVQDELVEEEGAALRIADAYDAYRTWADERDRPVQGRSSHFVPAVRREYAPDEGKDPADSRYSVWRDLALRSDPESAGGQTRL